MVNLLKVFTRGFIGGPNFDNCVHQRLVLEDKLLTLDLPNSNVAAAPSTIDISFPYNSKNWYEQHKEDFYYHEYVHMLTKNWMYLPPLNYLPSSEYGMLSCQLRIKQTNKINVLNTEQLKRFLVNEYDNFHWGPESRNVTITEEIKIRRSKSSVTWTDDEINEEIEEYIKLHGYPPLPPAKDVIFNNQPWVFYQEKRNNCLTRQDFYCLPLSECAFLEVEFNHRVDRSNKHKKWSKHALASQQRIMESIKLSEIPAERDNLITDNAEKHG
ncbi:hypothetical protein [Pseudoalteromonas sp. MB47]|uniref:hypothetical protein n=1 Tax=Pseudoalteromonas sp. MB47 TaxID=2588452 RepID=UPI00140D85C0|nr:hypothetical protein [Pseudoalteromonas sp. MB47]NHH87654.1 hypothetical protein [Pseudoalteromonas sp. MB47]